MIQSESTLKKRKVQGANAAAGVNGKITSVAAPQSLKEGKTPSSNSLDDLDDSMHLQPFAPIFKRNKEGELDLITESPVTDPEGPEVIERLNWKPNLEEIPTPLTRSQRGEGSPKKVTYRQGCGSEEEEESKESNLEKEDKEKAKPQITILARIRKHIWQKWGRFSQNVKHDVTAAGDTNIEALRKRDFYVLCLSSVVALLISIVPLLILRLWIFLFYRALCVLFPVACMVMLRRLKSLKYPVWGWVLMWQSVLPFATKMYGFSSTTVVVPFAAMMGPGLSLFFSGYQVAWKASVLFLANLFAVAVLNLYGYFGPFKAELSEGDRFAIFMAGTSTVMVSFIATSLHHQLRRERTALVQSIVEQESELASYIVSELRAIKFNLDNTVTENNQRALVNEIRSQSEDVTSEEREQVSVHNVSGAGTDVPVDLARAVNQTAALLQDLAAIADATVKTMSNSVSPLSSQIRSSTSQRFGDLDGSKLAISSGTETRMLRKQPSSLHMVVIALVPDALQRQHVRSAAWSLGYTFKTTANTEEFIREIKEYVPTSYSLSRSASVQLQKIPQHPAVFVVSAGMLNELPGTLVNKLTSQPTGLWTTVVLTTSAELNVQIRDYSLNLYSSTEGSPTREGRTSTTCLTAMAERKALDVPKAGIVVQRKVAYVATPVTAADLRRVFVRLSTALHDLIHVNKEKQKLDRIFDHRNEELWDIGPVLGRGSYGTVHIATSELTGARCAVKKIFVADQKRIRSVAREVAAMVKISHPNIVYYFYCKREQSTFYLFMELADCSLADLLKTPRGALAPTDAAWIIRRVLLGIQYLHSLGIVHHDIKPGNILLRRGIPKLSDLGCASRPADYKKTIETEMSMSLEASSVGFTLPYLAPEAVMDFRPDGRGKPTPAHDIWALGCVAAQLITGDLLPHMRLGPIALLARLQPDPLLRIPSQHSAKESKAETVNVDASLLGFPPMLTHLSLGFVDACLRIDPKLRPTATELLQHPFVNQPAALADLNHNVLSLSLEKTPQLVKKENYGQAAVVPPSAAKRVPDTAGPLTPQEDELSPFALPAFRHHEGLISDDEPRSKPETETEKSASLRSTEIGENGTLKTDPDWKHESW